MKKKRIGLLLLAIFLSITMFGCTRLQTHSDDYMKIPKQNKVELQKLWEAHLDARDSCSTIENNKLYVISDKQSIDVFNISNGEELKRIKLTEPEDDRAMSVSVYNGILTVNYSNFFIVVDTDTGKTLFKYEATKMPAVVIGYDQCMYKNLVIFNQIDYDYIAGMDYRTGKIKWKMGGNFYEYTPLSLYQYKGLYFYSRNDEDAYFQFDPETGNVIKKYEMKKGQEIKNVMQFGHLSTPKENIKDNGLKIWMINQNFGTFQMTDKGYIFTYYGNEFFFHGKDGKLVWKVILPQNVDIYLSNAYGRYSVLNCSNKIIILDLEKKEIVWEKKYKKTERIGDFINHDTLFLFEENGKLETYDLSKLEK